MFGPLDARHGPGWSVHHSDCVAHMLTMPENSVDSIVTDPPYHLTSMQARYKNTSTDRDGTNETRARNKSDGMASLAGGFMGRTWDGGDVAFRVETWRAAWRVLKPGGYIFAFASSRGYHRMACAIEDAGFITHPMIGWCFGSGFPKASNAARMIDKTLDHNLKSAHRRAYVQTVQELGLKLPGNNRHDWTIGDHSPGDRWWKIFHQWLPSLSAIERERIEQIVVRKGFKPEPTFYTKNIGCDSTINEYNIYAATSPEAQQWQGYYYGGQVRKPALEPIYVGQKPFSEKNGALNILRWGVGAVNIDGCRVETDDGYTENALTQGINTAQTSYAPAVARRTFAPSQFGRWPANLILDGSPEVVALFPTTGPARSGVRDPNDPGTALHDGGITMRSEGGHADSGGSAARFFNCYPPDIPPLIYSPKASSADRLGSKHPTVKPQKLMRDIIKHGTPPGGTILDPFAGTGSTLKAAVMENRQAIGIEADAWSVVDTVWRMTR